MGHCPHRTARNSGRLSDPCRTTNGDDFTEDPHPIHIHEIVFDVVDRQNLETGAVRGLEPWETGREDTVIAYPGREHPRQGDLRPARPVRLALPHRRTRGPRDDAPLPRGGRAVGGRAERVVTEKVAALPIPIGPWAWAPRVGDDDFGDVAGAGPDPS
jgi:FtsP/CotA-like multicopper oxidase with cupredoxin domain